ncbi:MAG: hypothetical protein GY707_16145 [Desulfobacteraceae bacterium]|nr:hypothetical protein [Desulfobacteraceae bacterium]
MYVIIPSCAEGGVLGVLPGIIGILQAVETIEVLLELGDIMSDRILQYDALSGGFQAFDLEKDPQCYVCSSEAGSIKYQDYSVSCKIE